jgi:plastocyanin
MIPRLVLLLCLLLAGPAVAGDLAISLTTPAGAPVADAVVSVRSRDAKLTPTGSSAAYRMTQKDMVFQPAVMVVPVGAEVSFPNLDKVHHHVYSFSKARTFELKLYGRGEARAVRFDRPGLVVVGCNIHDDMAGYILVVDTTAAKSSASGAVQVRGLPPGPATVTIWHARLRAKGGEIVRQVVVPASGVLDLSVALDLRAPPMRHGGY